MFKSTSEKLEFYAKNNANVMLIGKHGVGKTALIKATFEKVFGKMNEDWVYFSGSTMDPWVDFIGCPKERTDSETGLVYLDLVKPKLFAMDKVKAIFVDEFNRTHKKAINGCMEMLQFKSINGTPFKNLRVIWIAVNPKEEGQFKYDVEELDPAHRDRFQIHIDLPYRPDAEFFCDKYGDDIGGKAIKWWKALPVEQQDLISPRRLDYLLDLYLLGSDPKDIVDKKINIDKLLYEIKSGSFEDQLKRFFVTKNSEEARKFLSRPNAYEACKPIIQKNSDYIEFFIPLLGYEEISSMFLRNSQVRNVVYNGLHTNEDFVNILKSIVSSRILDSKTHLTAEKNLNEFLNSASNEVAK